jgi:lysophospholipase L1-like esterase
MAIVIVAAVAAVPFTAAAAPASVPSSNQPTSGLAYVALGDSYAAGYGLEPKTGKPVAACGQSSADYPHLIAKALGLRLTDATCAGAVTANIVSTPQNPDGQTTSPQSHDLGPATRVVTITIGGNDLGFVSAVKSCLALSAHGPILTTGRLSCRASFVKNDVDSLAQTVSNTVSGRLLQTFATVKKDAPNAKVFVVGYPALMPDAAHTPAKGCFAGSLLGALGSLNLKNAFPYTDTDVLYLHSIEVALDAATRAAATKTGFTYTSELESTEAHTPCGATPWLNGITVSSKDLKFALAPSSLHPNAQGAAHLAASVVPVIRRDFTATTPRPAPTSAPTPSPHSLLLTLWILAGAAIVVILVVAAVVITRRRKGE